MFQGAKLFLPSQNQIRFRSTSIKINKNLSQEKQKIGKNVILKNNQLKSFKIKNHLNKSKLSLKNSPAKENTESYETKLKKVSSFQEKTNKDKDKMMINDSNQRRFSIKQMLVQCKTTIQSQQDLNKESSNQKFSETRLISKSSRWKNKQSQSYKNKNQQCYLLQNQSQKNKQKNINSKILAFQNTQNKKSFEKLFGSEQSSKLNIHHTINFTYFCSNLSAQTQNKISEQSQTQQIHSVNTQTNEQFNHFKELKNKFLDSYQQKFSHYLKSTQTIAQFTKRHQDLINYKQSLTSQPREKKAYTIGADIERLEKKFTKQLNSIQKFESQKVYSTMSYRDKLAFKLDQIQNEVHNEDLIQQKSNLEDKIQNITFEIVSEANNFINQILNVNTNLLNIQQGFKQWTEAIKQNHTLIYNCVKHIQKMSENSITLFGDEQNNFLLGFSHNESKTQKIYKLMNKDCSKCFQTEQKLKYIYFQNTQIKPIMKALDILVKSIESRIK